jgi:hypothetical protein
MPIIIKKSLRFLAKLIAAVVLIYMLMFGWIWWDTSKVKRFCGELKIGLSVNALQTLAIKHGIEARLKLPGVVDEGTNNWLSIVPSYVTVGEVACLVRHNNVSVLSASFQSPDGE